MSLPITRTNVQPSGRVARVGAAMIASPVVLLAAVAYGPAALTQIGHFFRGVGHTLSAGGSHVSDVPLTSVFVAFLVIISAAIGLAVHDRSADEDHEVFDVR